MLLITIVLYLLQAYERKFSEGDMADFQCESCSFGIQVIWADYGVQLQQRYPFTISKADPNCRTTNATSVMQTKCDGKAGCSFKVSDADFLSSGSNCQSDLVLLVRYKCRKNVPGILLGRIRE